MDQAELWDKVAGRTRCRICSTTSEPAEPHATQACGGPERFGKDALVDRRRLYKIAHQASPQSKEPTTDVYDGLCSRMVCTRCGLIGADVRPNWSPHTNHRAS